MTEWMSKYGSGNAPIAPRDEILRLQQEEEAALLRAEKAARNLGIFMRRCPLTGERLPDLQNLPEK